MRKCFLFGVFLFGLWLLAAPPCHAQKPVTAYGSIEALDCEIGTITILILPKYEPKQFNLSRPDLPVTDDALDQPLKLADLKKKQRVALNLDEMDDVASIRLDDNCQWGAVVRVQPAERELTISYSSQVERTFPVPAEVAVVIDGTKAQFAALKVGHRIKAVYSPDQRTLLQLQAGKGIPTTNPYHQYTHLFGTLTKIDRDRGTLQVEDKSGTRDYAIQPWAVLRLLHSSYFLRATDLTTLRPPCKIDYHIESDSQKLVQIRVQVPVINRQRVETVDREGRQLTLKVGEKVERLSVPADAMIRTPRGLARWEDVATGSLVTCGLTLDGKEAVYLYLWDK